MKLALALLISAISAPAFATGLSCVTSVPLDKTGIAKETFTLKEVNNFFQIGHFGSSRNTYSAVYKVTESIGTRYGSVSTLEKVADLSTWKNMPEHVVLNTYTVNGHFDQTLGGFPGFYSVQFTKENCHE